MVTSKQRQRQLARAKWERQQERRTEVARRQRNVTIVLGVILGLIVAAGLVWLVMHIVDEENSRNPSPAVPTDSFSTQLRTPTPDSPSATGTGTPTDTKPTDTTAPTSPTASKTGGN